VQQTYPNAAEVVGRAKSRTGFTFFTVQLATFANPQTADATVMQLMRDGVNPKRVSEPRGTHAVTIGPCATHAQAQQLKARYIARFPNAVIVP
jgi:cell division septation protein DedD